MINRELIRLKLVQTAYSYYQKHVHNPEVAEKELLVSMSHAHDLYNFMLLLMVEVNRMGLRSYEMRLNRSHRLNETVRENRKFIDNRFMAQLENDRQLIAFRDSQAFSWMEHEDFLRHLYTQIEESEYYQQYMNSGISTFEEDREIWRLIYRHLICNNEELDEVLEGMCLYWNDDKVVVDTFVLKTINRFTADGDNDKALMPEFRNDADREFALRLLRRALNGADYFRELIAANTKNWDYRRIALMDRIILQFGLAEITSFPGIPLSVSINEYVEVAHMYSTPKSGKFINATLDRISKQLIKEHKLVKDELVRGPKHVDLPNNEENQSAEKE